MTGSASSAPRNATGRSRPSCCCSRTSSSSQPDGHEHAHSAKRVQFYDPGMTLPDPGPDRTAVVTGASSGIGAEIARGLAERGYGVALVARREDRLRELAEELQASEAVRAEVVAADMTDESAREGLVKEVADRGLTVDSLVNNAGF